MILVLWSTIRTRFLLNFKHPHHIQIQVIQPHSLLMYDAKIPMNFSYWVINRAQFQWRDIHPHHLLILTHIPNQIFVFIISPSPTHLTHICFRKIIIMMMIQEMFEVCLCLLVFNVKIELTLKDTQTFGRPESLTLNDISIR